MSVERSLLNQAFDRYYSKGIDSLQVYNYKMAARNLLSAAETLTKIAKITNTDERHHLNNRAEELLSYVEIIKSKFLEGKVLETNIKPINKSNHKQNNDNKNSTTNFTSVSDKPSITFDDVAGLEDVKSEITRLIVNPIKFPEVFKEFKVDQGGGILLYGVPGTGKTMIAQAIASEIDAEFYSVKSSDIFDMYVGSSENNVKEVFDEARKHARSIIFFDEFDAIGSKRDANKEVAKRVVNELLMQMQGFDNNDNLIIVIAATNRPWDLDSALMRPGRFNRLLEVPLPDDMARRKILELKLDNVPIVENFDYDYIVEVTEGHNASDVVEFVQRLKYLALERTIKEEANQMITNDDIDEVLETFSSSVSEQDLKDILRFKKTNLK